MTLKHLGWTQNEEAWLEAFSDPTLVPGRVSIEYNQFYLILSEHGDVQAQLQGKLKHQAASGSDLPKVGDWVLMKLDSDKKSGIIYERAPRRTALTRKSKGDKLETQVIATNIDLLFIVMGLDLDFNLRRLERYLVLANEGNIKPVILLNKCDLCDDVYAKVAEVTTVSGNVNVLPISVKSQYGFDKVQSFIEKGVTVAFVGSSGVGKSSIINTLIKEDRQKVGEVRQDDHKGMHTTRHRELILFKDKGILIDTPGIREIQLWEANKGIKESFSDIEELSQECHFRNCKHDSEIKCAVKNAVDDGVISMERYLSFIKLNEELAKVDARKKSHAGLKQAAFKRKKFSKKFPKRKSK